MNGKKTVILDACAVGDNIENAVLPKNFRIISSNEVPLNNSLAMIFWDSIYAFGNDFDNLDQETFDKQKHNWIYYKETK